MKWRRKGGLVKAIGCQTDGMPVSVLPEPPAPRPRLAGRLHSWAGHRAAHVMAVAIVGQGACFAVHDRLPLAALVLILLATVLALWSVTASLAHAGGLCAACLAEMPLDAPVRAERRYRRLWLFHVTHEPPLLATRLVLTFGCGVCGPLGLTVAWALGLWGVSCVLWVSALFGSVAHRRVSPWCRYCGWDERDDDGATLDGPDPVIPRRPGA